MQVDLGAEPDVDRVVVAPSFVDDLSWARGAVETPLGRVESRWETTANGHALTVRVPWNADGRVDVPADGDALVHVDGERIHPDGTHHPTGVETVRRNGRRVAVEVEPGSYEFRLE